MFHRAHPRSRGENLGRRFLSLFATGSSPLTRGKQLEFVPELKFALAHPRSRGENVQPATTAQIDAGSSPLTRGKHDGTDRCDGLIRLIPAHAGKTLSVIRTAAPPMAHPRSRGENRRRCDATDSTTGSSPLTRGKQDLGYRCDGLIGLIPAHAGKTCPDLSHTTIRQAHPRSRGENCGAIPSRQP